MQEPVKLSDEQLDEIATRVSEKMRADLYANVGQGILGLAFKGFLLLILMLAAYGAGHGLFK